MICITLSLTVQSPLLLATGPPSHNLIETMDQISGNSLRGLLAQRYLAQGGKPEDPVFQDLFLSGKIRFGFGTIKRSHAIPLSARSCKYEPGFKNQDGHGIIDLLLDGGEEKLCSTCGQSIDYFEGFWDPSSGKKPNVRKRLITRTAIDPTLGVATIGQLYSQKVIEEGQTFIGDVEVPDDVSTAVLDALKGLISVPFTAGIGTGRSRGQGWVQVRHESCALTPWGTAKDRFEQFRKKTGLALLAITLLSDAIFQDEYFRDCTGPDISHVTDLKINPAQWKPKMFRRFASNRTVFGFDGMPVRLPRLPRLAVRAGSVFLFQAVDGIDPTIPDGDGVGWVGDKNAEGFGKVVLWHPFHLEPERRWL